MLSDAVHHVTYCVTPNMRFKNHPPKCTNYHRNKNDRNEQIISFMHDDLLHGVIQTSPCIGILVITSVERSKTNAAHWAQAPAPLFPHHPPCPSYNTIQHTANELKPKPRNYRSSFTRHQINIFPRLEKNTNRMFFKIFHAYWRGIPEQQKKEEKKVQNKPTSSIFQSFWNFGKVA